MGEMKVCVKPMSIKKIRLIANIVRNSLNLNARDKFPILQLLEWCMAGDQIEVEIVEQYEMKDAYAITDTSSNVIRIRQDVYDGAAQGNPRDIFTLCHELGHFLLHKPDRIEFARASEELPKFRDAEWQANTFASEIMAPYEEARKMSEEEIAKTYGMSRQAASIRYKKCRS